VLAVCARLGVGGPIGVTFPGVVRAGTVETAANMDPSWIGVDAGALFGDRLRRSAVVLNDADAAGIAEMRFGAGRGRGGVVVMVTLGTGIGSALFLDGGLVPNTEPVTSSLPELMARSSRRRVFERRATSAGRRGPVG
jgi:polyphosphate glucokinase